MFKDPHDGCSAVGMSDKANVRLNQTYPGFRCDATKDFSWVAWWQITLATIRGILLVLSSGYGLGCTHQRRPWRNLNRLWRPNTETEGILAPRCLTFWLQEVGIKVKKRLVGKRGNWAVSGWRIRRRAEVAVVWWHVTCSGLFLQNACPLGSRS